MKKWDRFALHQDIGYEKQLLKCYNTERKALNTAIYMLSRDLGGMYETGPEMVSVGALWRCGTCLESILALTRDGYIGSANALLRQVYEFLVWSKITISTKDSDRLKSLHDNFYNFEMSGKADGLKNIFNHIHYSSETLSTEQIKEKGKDVFNKYAFSTHASVYAQQCPVKTDDFYKNMKSCYVEIAIWILCYMELIKEHFKRCIHEQSNSLLSEYEQLLLYSLYNSLTEIIRKEEVRIIALFPGIENDLLYRCFTEAMWVMV